MNAAERTVARRDRGFTLIEVLVGMALFGVLSSLVLAFGVTTAHLTDETSNSVDLNEESRIAFERFARDLRDADRITKVMPAAGTDSGCPDDEFIGVAFTEASSGSAVVPKAVAYKWDIDTGHLILSEDIPDPEQQPILAAEVSHLCIKLWSSRWSPLPTHPDQGTSWAELDPPSPSPDDDGWWCTHELADVDRVSLSMTASMHGHERSYGTDVFLRNARIGEGVTDAEYCS